MLCKYADCCFIALNTLINSEIGLRAIIPVSNNIFGTVCLMSILIPTSNIIKKICLLFINENFYMGIKK